MASALAHGVARPAPAPSNVSDLRNNLVRGRAVLKAAFGKRPDAAKALQRQCALADAALQALWTETGQSGELALIAVGGYGRGLLYPYSDVDVLILLPDDAGDGARSGVEALVGVLWDVGLEIGHSVRTVGECQDEARRDITIQTTLLESRLIAGSR